jgi:superfamily I DNA and/or RNA helicase
MGAAAPALAALKPLVLASPLSAATLLPPDFPPFDLVVFDEASQVPVWDAACAISRASAAVIVGDSKQLPPTNFFDRKDSSDSDDSEAALADALEPLESVLEEAIASGIPQQSLLWHYRSRDERLIEFSNRRSYGGRLQTFPAAHRAHPNLGVEFRFVGGVYDRAGTATNRAEAEAVVAEVVRRLIDPDSCTANRSIGVVTFSVAQQTLVQDLFDEALDRDARVREGLAESAKLGDPVFIKNLENVQGDERATMLFSICYGRDASGAMYHNFGPINLSGGERRLNVAVTRAREKIVIFSSIRASDLDPKKCISKGAQDLRDYLAFAELGTVPSARDEAGPQRALDIEAVELAIARALEARGWKVDLHVGRSRDFRVSLALADRNAPDRWVLGVELDGIFHRAAPTVIDRESVREGVLDGLGWKTVRISAIDALRDLASTVDRIESAARSAR